MHVRTGVASSVEWTRPASSRLMTPTYQHDTPAGQLKIRQFKGGLWRLWAGDDFLGSFTSGAAAVHALLDGTCGLPAGGRKAGIKVPLIVKVNTRRTSSSTSEAEAGERRAGPRAT